MRSAPYGYDFVDGKLVINQEEADFVRMVYHWYIEERMTMREIGEKLYELGAMPKRKESRNWNASSIRRMLTSEIYIGKYYYNRSKSKKIKGEVTASGRPKKTREMRDEEDWLLVEVPAIVDDITFELAQTQKVKNTIKSGNLKNEYLLKGIIRCSCGRIWHSTNYSGRKDPETGEKKKYAAYRCPNKAPKNYGPEVKKCTMPSIRAELFDNYIWNLIIETLSNPQDYQEVLDELSTDTHSDFKNDIINKKKHIKQKEKQKEKLKNLYLDDLISQEELKKDMEKINNEILIVNNEIKKFEKLLSIQEKTALTEERKKMMLTAAKDLLKNDGLDFKEKKFILQKLIDEIAICYNEENNELNVKIVGALGDFLNDDEANSLF